jgi:hypothetical protein
MKIALKLVALLLALFVFTTFGAVSAQDDIEFPEPTDSIAVDDEVTGELSEDDPLLVYSFDSAAGDIVGVNVAFDDIDGYLLLADAKGNIIAENDDSISIYDSTIPAVELPEDGTYLIGVSTYSYVRGDDPSDEGSFTLTLTMPDIEVIEIGGAVEGELTEDEPTALYFVDAEAGQLLVIAVESDDFDTQLSLDPVSGQDVSQEHNDDYGEGTNSQIGPLLVAESGRYVISVSSYFEDEGGSFALTVSEAEPIVLEIGEAARGELTMDASEQYYSFEAEEEQTVTIAAEALGDADLYFTVYDSAGEWLDYADDTDDLNPSLEFEAPESGTYLIQLSSWSIFFDEDESGEYEITVTTGASSPAK